MRKNQKIKYYKYKLKKAVLSSADEKKSECGRDQKAKPQRMKRGESFAVGSMVTA